MSEVEPGAPVKKRPWALIVVAGLLAAAVATMLVVLAETGSTGTPSTLPTATAEPTPAATPTPTSTPTPTASPTATAEPPAPQRDLVLSEVGLDDLLLGDTAQQLNASPLLTAFELDCGDGPFPAWKSAPREGLEGGAIFGVFAYDGVLKHIQVRSDVVVTDRGGGVGMSTVEMAELYPEASFFSQTGYIMRYAAEYDQTTFYFDVWVGENEERSRNRTDHVLLMGISPGGLDSLERPSYHPVSMSCL
ncbi:hypothetical protein IWX81_001185 [Salinibacterium sp. CAN_S4]|uniref:hypothetical protein n=1 Tax=Salinibacterium sp. CAN_S4 TaxID=2787727 RepID=UPI0018EF8BDF